jgi:hypothetical protein
MQEILHPIKTDDLLVIGADVYHGETQDKTKYVGDYATKYSL